VMGCMLPPSGSIPDWYDNWVIHRNGKEEGSIPSQSTKVPLYGK